MKSLKPVLIVIAVAAVLLFSALSLLIVTTNEDTGNSPVASDTIFSRPQKDFDAAETILPQIQQDYRQVKNEESVASADIFGKGGSATDIDAVLLGADGIKSEGDGGVGRKKGAAGIGYGSGYGSGFGGSGLEKPGELRMRKAPIRTVYSYDSERAENYSSFSENRFKDAKSEPLSTFSLDVDAASYSNVRRMINQGQKPNKDAVRVEQFINYFSYDYPNPEGEHPVNIITETQPCPWNKDHLLVRIGMKAKEVPSKNLPPSNFVFLIDVSGSMISPNRLPLVKSSLKLLTNNLREKDRVSIVVYAGAAGEVLPSTSGADKQKIIEAVDALQAGGSTAGGAGIQLAYRVARNNFIKGGNNRVILCTDGDFNVGVSSEKELENLIEEKRKTGVFLTVLGYGMGNYKDSKLQILSQKGNGNHAYIDNLQEANRVLVQEFGSTMYAVAKDVKMQVEFNPAYVNAYRLAGYESRLLNKEDFNDDTKDAGELGAGHTVTAFYEIIPVGVKNTFGDIDDLKYQKPDITETVRGVKNNEMMTVKLRYKPLDSERSIKMEIPIMTGDRNKAPSADFTFAAAAAMFGQLLRDSDFKGTSSYDNVIALARKGFGEDRQGYRREFVRLAEAAKQLTK
ncbi:MAG: VWA domain-containing protein [Chitinispirillales bacterium]|nr:VWA domain-containing protein [Chitinispirillales bacterium]